VALCRCIRLRILESQYWTESHSHTRTHHTYRTICQKNERIKQIWQGKVDSNQFYCSKCSESWKMHAQAGGGCVRILRCIYMCVSIYMYMGRQKERERERISLCVCVVQGMSVSWSEHINVAEARTSLTSQCRQYHVSLPSQT